MDRQQGGAGARRRVRASGVQAQATPVVRRHRPDYSILTYTSILVMIGLIIIFAIGPQRANVLNVSYGATVSDTHFIIKQLISVGLAVGAFVLTAFIVPYQLMKRFSVFILGTGLLLCLLLFITGNLLHIDAISSDTLGAHRWFNVPGFGTIQPAEVLKLGILLYVSSFLGARMKSGEMDDWGRTLVPLIAVFSVSALFVVVAQKDLGTGISMLAIVMAMVIATNISTKKILGAIGAVVAVGILAIVSAPHRISRVLTFMQGDEINLDDPASYHIAHAKIAIGSGGFDGVGIGNSVQAAGYLPEAINDSVFAILGETFGFIGLVFILTMFYMLLIKILNIANALPDHSQRLLVVGMFGWIFAHVTINIGAMTGLVPLTGITLPFLSFGGTSILIIALALGIVFQLSRYTAHTTNRKDSSDEDISSRRRVRRPRYTSSRGSL